MDSNRRSVLCAGKMCCWPLLAVSLLVAGGCGKYTTHPVGGVVERDDGTPLPNTVVTFEAVDGSLSAYGMTDARGRFRLSTVGREDGAVAGRYRVSLRPVDPDPEVPEPPIQIDPKYFQFETSGLEFEVARGTNEFQIVVER